MRIHEFLEKRKYEVLLMALIQHLYVGIFVRDMMFYVKVLWPINMLILGLATVGVFSEKGKWKKIIKNILTFLVILLPLLLPFFSQNLPYMFFLNIAYIAFFSFVFVEIFKFLVRPSYINKDIISAAACGMFLIIEVFVFYFQLWVYLNHDCFKGLNFDTAADTYTDLVYFCSITMTTIGYGDITPNVHHTKLATSLLGVIGQFYSVVLVGIIISKFTSHINKN